MEGISDDFIVVSFPPQQSSRDYTFSVFTSLPIQEKQRQVKERLKDYV